MPQVSALLADVRAHSYPELQTAEITLKRFSSDTTYFQARFRFWDFFFRRKLRYLIGVNPDAIAKGAPENGLRAILAHELGHVLYYKTRHRLRLLGLFRLLSPRFTARFERETDLRAILRGHAAGLAEYREWLYRNIPPASLPAKQRTYFSPDEIASIEQQRKQRPAVMNFWWRKPPLSLQSIEATAVSVTPFPE